MSSNIRRIIEHIEFEYEFATDDERLNSSLLSAERNDLLITAAASHLEEVCRSFDKRRYDSYETGFVFDYARVDVSLKNYSIERNGDSLTFVYELVYDVDGDVSEDELNEFASDTSYAYDSIHLDYELYCMSDEVARHFEIINESDVEEIEAIETSFSRSVKFE